MARVLRFVSAALALPLGNAAGIPPPGIRDSLLCETQRRVDFFKSSPEELQEPSKKDGVTIWYTKKSFPCHGADVPVAFVEFDVPNARPSVCDLHLPRGPADVFNVMTSYEHEKDWNHAVHQVHHLADWPDQGVRGMARSYFCQVWADRECYQWSVFNKSASQEEYIIADTTDANGALHEEKPEQHKSVQFQICFGASLLRPSKTTSGATTVLYTVHVNPQAGTGYIGSMKVSLPVPIPLSWVVKFTWQQQVDWANSLRKRVEVVSGGDATDQPVMQSLLSPAKTTSPTSETPFAKCLREPSALFEFQSESILGSDKATSAIPALTWMVLLGAGPVVCSAIAIKQALKRRRLAGQIHARQVDEEVLLGAE